MALNPGELLIDDSYKDSDNLYRFDPDGFIRARGGVPRDYSVQPYEMRQSPDAIAIIPESEWSARIKELEAKKALVSSIRDKAADGQVMPCLDQGQVGYCWAHSVTHNMMLKRASRNLPYVPLSAYSIAAIIKNGRDEGGWCGLSGEFAGKVGAAPQSKWPQGQRNVRQYDNADMRAVMALYRTTEDWMDVTKPAYSRNLNWQQFMSLLLSGEGCAADFNWWGHSVFAMDPVEVEPGSFGIRILNSWGMAWGTAGAGVLRGDKARPDGAVCIRDVVLGAAA